jgi:phosphoserine phosphatase RsbU/P
MEATMGRPSYGVLVTDDSAANRKYLEYVLEEDGYRLLLAESGEQCLEIARVEKPALILLDVVMGGIDGFETLRRLKLEPETVRTPVIMLTSLDDQESKLKAFELGAVDYIVKSASPAEVKARVRVHMRLRLATEELIASNTESLSKLGAMQKSFLIQPGEIPDATFSVYYKSLQEAGGDFYDVVPVSDGVYFYFLADVSGHDIATSYITPAVKVLLKQFATPAFAVEETVSYMNGILSQTVCSEYYLTAFALRINRRAMKAVLLVAGHPPAVFIPKEGPCRFVGGKGPLIGMIENATYRSETMDVQPGDRFLLYTDGLVEGGDPPVAWTASYQTLLPVVERLKDRDLGDLPNAVAEAMGAAGINDDVALLAVEV